MSALCAIANGALTNRKISALHLRPISHQPAPDDYNKIIWLPRGPHDPTQNVKPVTHALKNEPPIVTSPHLVVLDALFTLILVLTAIACALYARRQHKLTRNIAKRDLRLEIKALNATLLEDAHTVRTKHAAYRNYIDATFSVTNLSGSDEHAEYIEKWENDSARILKAISILSNDSIAPAHLSSSSLENRLVELKILERDLERIGSESENVILDSSFTLDQDQ